MSDPKPPFPCGYEPSTPCRLSEIVTDILYGLQARASRKHVILRMLHPTAEEAVPVRRRSIYQALRILALRALKETPPGGVVAIRIDASARHSYVAVADCGRGLALGRFQEALLGKAKLPVPAPLPTTALMACLDIVRSHGGQIRITSEVGLGTTYIVELPK